MTEPFESDMREAVAVCVVFVGLFANPFIEIDACMQL